MYAAWYIGGSGKTCTETCAGESKQCILSFMDAIKSANNFVVASGETCLDLDDNPVSEVRNDAFYPGLNFGMCTYRGVDGVTCDAFEIGVRRLCYCDVQP